MVGLRTSGRWGLQKCQLSHPNCREATLIFPTVLLPGRVLARIGKVPAQEAIELNMLNLAI